MRLTIKACLTVIIILIVIPLIVVLYAPVRIPYCLLPDKAADFIETRFPGVECVYAERDHEDGGIEYEVDLSNGASLEFTSSGEWKKVDCGYSLLPKGVLPPAIEADVAARYPDARIYKAERARGGYKVKVGNGLEMIYSSDGTFVRMDN